MSTGSVAVRTRIAENIAYIDLRISHPMEPGTRKDRQGILIPAWYLTHMDVYYNDARIAKLELGPLVSRNPAISLAMEGGIEGELIKVTWLDNRGKGGERNTKLVA